MDTIRLSDIKKGMPGISPVEGANLYENCIVALHNEAMDLALKGDIAANGDPKGDESIALYTEAFEKEREAALLADFMQNPEPGLSILYRSAASLAMQCGRYREAEQLIAKALSGNPTEELARELRQLLQNIYMQSGRDEDSVKAYRDINNAINTAKKDARQAEKVNTALKMKADGMSAELIAKYTSLSIDEIKNL